jgi:hypothetical protein
VGLVFVVTAIAVPPFGGTIFIDPDIVRASEISAFESATYAGQGTRTMFDRRPGDWINVNAYLFNAVFSDGLTAEIQVNPEFGSESAAQIEADIYGQVIGQLATALRSNMETVWIHKGVEAFGGGNNNILIHTGQSALYTADGILEETLIHEAAHTSLDPFYANNADWLAAQQADNEFISTYAQDFPDREDIAESFLPYVAIRYREDRISQTLRDQILQTMPNRIAFFDSLELDMFPLTEEPDIADRDGDGIPDEDDLCPDFPGRPEAQGC